jgi:hypothetical protein
MKSTSLSMKSTLRKITTLSAMALFSLSVAHAQTPVTVNNFSFEADNNAVPSGWTGFNLGFSGAVSGNYNQNTPLAAPADGNNYFAMNKFPGDVVGGIYQDVGNLQPNTLYTLTVAMGERADRINSPGIIALINGSDNTGPVLTSGGGNASVSGTWQDYTVTFTTGPSVSGDLTVELADAGAGTIQANFDNVRLTATSVAATPAPTPITVTNYSFEAETDPSIGVPSSWTAFNDANFSTVTTAVGNGYTAAADGNNFFAINEGPTDLPGGIYQDVGALQPNTRYTLTVATGRQSGFNQGSGLGSPAIISLINGIDDTGSVLASGSWIPASTSAWQDYNVTFTTGPSVSGDLTVELAVAPASTYQAAFDNVRLSATAVPATPTPAAVTVTNYSFEAESDVWVQGVPGIPSSWTAFNDSDFSTVQSPGGSDFPAGTLAPPADGTNFFAINESPSEPIGGLYQDVGALKPNTKYTLTVATGRSFGFGYGSGLGSPAIISLLNGSDNTGAALTSSGWIPATPGTWQDYTVTYTTGASVSGDLTVQLSVLGASTYQAAFDNVRLTSTTPLVAPSLVGKVSGGALILTGSGGTPNNGYTLLTTTSLATPISWTTNSTGTLDSTGSFSKNVPISSAPPAGYFRVRLP